MIGLLVVHTRALAGACFENSRPFRTLLLCSATVTGLGLWLCYSSLHTG